MFKGMTIVCILILCLMYLPHVFSANDVDTKPGPFISSEIKYLPESILAKIKLDERLAPFFKKHGEALLLKKIAHDRTYCYYNPIEDAYLEIIAHIDALHTEGISVTKVSDEPLLAADLRPRCKTKIIKDVKFVTGKGISLGDTIEKVIHVYGKPTRKTIGKSRKEIKLQYEDDKGLYYEAMFVFTNNRLTSISIYYGE